MFELGLVNMNWKRLIMLIFLVAVMHSIFRYVSFKYSLFYLMLNDFSVLPNGYFLTGSVKYLFLTIFPTLKLGFLGCLISLVVGLCIGVLFFASYLHFFAGKVKYRATVYIILERIDLFLLLFLYSIGINAILVIIFGRMSVILYGFPLIGFIIVAYKVVEDIAKTGKCKKIRGVMFLLPLLMFGFICYMFLIMQFVTPAAVLSQATHFLFSTL